MSLFDFLKNNKLTKFIYVRQEVGSLEDRYIEDKPLFTPNRVRSLDSDDVFVFGSNLDGYHTEGAAKVALKKFGAVWGQGVGLQGQSYAIPTIPGGIETMKPYVEEFLVYAKKNQDRYFYVTRVGCGIAGFKDEEIAPLFGKALLLNNVCLPKSFINAISVIGLPNII